MLIKRIQIEEGFLGGVDLQFRPGLNVIVGPRGSGKTSIIELIRFCLNIPGFTQRSNTTAREHALSVLGSGEVSVTIDGGGHDIVVTRTANENAPRISMPFVPPIILSQNEIEAVGLDAEGRLRIIDGFRKQPSDIREEQTIVARIKSLTTEIGSLADEVKDLDERLGALRAAPEQLETAKLEQKKALQAVNVLASDIQNLDQISSSLASINVRQEAYSRAIEILEAYSAKVIGLLPPPDFGGFDVRDAHVDLEYLHKGMSEVSDSLNGIIGRLKDLAERIGARSEDASGARIKLEQKAREIRQRLEAQKEGAGAASRRVSELESDVLQLRSLGEIANSRRARLEHLRSEREQVLNALDELRARRFEFRKQAANTINERLAPKIKVKVIRSGHHPELVRSITEALRGSGLHYNTLAPTLANEANPRELVRIVENGDPSALARITGVSIERAVRIVSEISNQGTGDILTAAIEDQAVFSLLDGTEYKPTDELSTGQRCTVILPILLGHHGRVLIVDQPEDHLDNAFIVETLIEAIKKRLKNEQLIFSTHNANIPVIGNASLVIHMGSDGSRGFVRHALPLNDPQSVEAITSIMEGGKEAFELRASFYHTH